MPTWDPRCNLTLTSDLATNCETIIRLTGDAVNNKRASFDFEVEFSNGGGLQGQGFRLDIDGDGITDDALAAYVIKDLRLLMVERVKILNKTVVEELHQRSCVPAPVCGDTTPEMVDLSHMIESDMITYKGLPAPLVCDYISRHQSRELYAAGTEFQIGRIDMVGNTGTYIDTPYHRYSTGDDLSQISLLKVSNLAGVVVRVTGIAHRAIDWMNFAAIDVRGRAVLVNTDWDRYWRSDRYFEGHPFLTKAAAEYLREAGAALVGIDSLNIDDTSDPTRPVHTVLLGAGIPIVEHLTNLSSVPAEGFVFFSVPPKIRAMGTFPVRAHAIIHKA